VRQAYFTGAGEPYDKLKRALRAEIDEEARAAGYVPCGLCHPHESNHREDRSRMAITITGSRASGSSIKSSKVLVCFRFYQYH
jgi:hypothetical protein